MDTEPFVEFLAELDERALTRLLAARPDVCLEPVPRSFVQLAQRLCGANSIVTALRTVDRDTLVVGQGIAVLGGSATVPAVARLLGASEKDVRRGVGELRDRGLAWTSGDRPHLPELLRAHWAAAVGGGRPVAEIAPAVLVEDLRGAADRLGAEVEGLRKSQLVARLSAAMTDPRALVPVIRALPPQARARLDELRHGGFGIVFGHPGPGRHRGDPTDVLVANGLVFRPRHVPVVPREVALAAWLADTDVRLTGRPRLPAAGVDAAEVRSAAQAAARETARGLSALLDEAARAPLAALKQGGVGTRERSRLAKRLSVGEDVLVLWIDLAHAAGLLGATDAGYAPTDAYPAWRDAEPGAQWAAAVAAWHALEHAPLSRETEADKQLPPPLPLVSAAGHIRRAVLRAAGGGLSVRAAGAAVDWFFPVHEYEPDRLATKVDAALREAELLGVVAGDRVTELGEHLVSATAAAGDVVAEIALRCAPLLPAAGCQVILQSDLTAVVSGQPGAAVSRLLTAAAVSETRDSAAIWRFTPASVRGALDAGWTGQGLLAELAELTGRAVPQPLEYLVKDAERRHGQVRVRAVRSCLVADEPLTTEILNTRSLAELRLSRLGPTVLASPHDLDHVLARLRAAGLSPVAEDATGAVVVEERAEHRAERDPLPAARPAARPGDLARQLRADPDGDHAPDSSSGTFELLSGLNPELDEAELSLLAHAVDHHDDVLIAYRDRTGNRTIRRIQPEDVDGPWLESWCYLRNADRQFTVANIESVAPAG